MTSLETSSQFWRMLCKVDTLVESKNASVDPIPFQSEIQRQLCSIQWLLQLEGHQVDPDTKEHDTLAMKKALLEEIREAVGANPEHLKSMAIPQKPVPPKDTRYFPFYKFIPELARLRILDFVSDPQDRIHLAKAMPYEASLMGWTARALKLEQGLVRRLVENPNLWQNSGKMEIFRASDPVFGTMLNQHYSNLLTGNASRFRPLTSFYGAHTLSGFFTVPEKCPEEPLLTQVHITLRSGKNEKVYLEKVGKMVWDLKLTPFQGISPSRAVHRLEKVLKMTPNVKKLTLREDPADPVQNWQQLTQEWETLKKIPFPKLPQLKSLVIVAHPNSGSLELLRRKILQNYGHQLKQLAFFKYESNERADQNEQPPLCQSIWALVGYPLTVLDFDLKMDGTQPLAFWQAMQLLSKNFGGTLREIMLHAYSIQDQMMPRADQLPVFSRLTSLKIMWRLVGEEQALVDILGWFRHSALSIVEVKLSYYPLQVGLAGKLWNLPKIMSCLHAHFAESLEALKLELECYRDLNTPQIWPLELAEATFKKLKTLKLQVLPPKLNWDFLLLCPALEKVIFTDVSERRSYHYFPQNVDNSGDGLIEWHSDIDQMVTSNIWKLMINLEELVFENSAGHSADDLKKKTLTRKQCVEEMIKKELN